MYMADARDQYRFGGFDEPHYTQIPDVFFDEVMCHLTEAELRVALYIMRRTFGFKKRADAISFSQFLKGITTRDGRRLDHGCGIAGRTNLTRALKGLEEKGIIIARRSISAKGDAQTTVYELRFRESEVVPHRDHLHAGVVPPRDHLGATVVTADDHRGDPVSPPVVIERDRQETAIQERENRSAAISIEDEAPRLTTTLDAVSEALGDLRHRPTNRTRAARILNGLSDEYGARIAELALARVTAIVQTQGGVKNRMAYYFTVLDDLARQARATTRATTPARDHLSGRYAHLVRR